VPLVARMQGVAEVDRGQRREVLVAVLQAYVFATLTSIYLSDALHPGH
jgi:hypothetical protein